MPFRTLRLAPGVNLEQSETLNQTQLAQSNLIRFYGGLVQKLGGWLQLTAATFIGVCRGLHGWSDIVGNPYLAVGTEQRLSVVIGGAIDDITPLAATENPAVAFSTVSGSALVIILDAGHSPSAGDWINLLTQVSVGGLVLFGFYQVQSVIDGSHYVIDAAALALSTVTDGGAVPAYTTTNGVATVSVAFANHGLSAGALFEAAVSTTVATVVISGLYDVTSVTDANTFVITAATTANASTTASENGGDARIEYLLPTGYAVNTPLTGYGIGEYGAGDYGVSGAAQAVGHLRQWSLDHWGQDLIASPSGGGIYYWAPPTPAPAIVLSSGAPLYNTAVFVMSQAEIIIALGAETSGIQEPLLVRWCDVGDFTDWTASATNQAGSFSLPTGSRIVGGLSIGLGALIWTDVDLWSMSYLGFPLVFGFNRIATGCGLMSQRAAGVVGSIIMWLSTRGFFNYTSGGGITPLECPVWDFLFNNIDTSQLDQVHCAPNPLFNEFAWHFPINPASPIYSADAPFGYVKVNYAENFVWDFGQSSQYQRTAWVGVSANGTPIGADTAGLLQQHEISKDANGAGMQWSWQTGYFTLGDGEDFSFLDMIIPDFVMQWDAAPPVISLELLATDYPFGLGTSSPTVCGPYVLDAATSPLNLATLFVPCNVRARQIALSAYGSDIGTFNRVGAIRFRFAPDGRF